MRQIFASKPCRIGYHARILFCVTVGLMISTYAEAQVTVGTIKQVSIGSNSTVPSGASGSPAIAMNSQKLVFNSVASNLVSEDTNNVKDVFESDLSTGLTSRVSISSAGVQGDAESANPSISQVGPDGFYAIAFESEASNLGSVIDTSGNRDIFIRIPALALTEYVSLGDGRPGNADSRAASLTVIPQPNRILVAFESDSSSLISADNNKQTDVYLATMTVPAVASSSELLASLQVVRVSSGSQESDGASAAPKISGDGAYVVFTSSATNLIAGQTISGRQVYRYNVSSGEISLISRDAAGLAGNGNSYGASISYSGRFIAYVTEASSIISGAASGAAAAVLFDTLTGVATRFNSSLGGVAGDGSVTEVSISANGKSATFSDSSSNLVDSDTNNLADVFLKDFSTGQISRISIGESGNQGNAKSDLPAIAGSGFNSPNGLLVFRSFATNFTAASLASGSDIFANSAVLPARLLARNTALEVPPDVAVSGNKGIFTFEKFSGVSSQALLAEKAELSRPRAEAMKIRYDIRVRKAGGKAKDNIRKISKRNQIALKRLKPGNYTAKYRALSTRNEKTVRATKFSPVQKFTVVKK